MKTFFKSLSIILASITLIIASPLLAHAELSNATLDFMGVNEIYYYNPDGASNCVPGTNSNYSGAQVLDGALTSAIQANQAFYKESADKYGFDWRIIAAIHIMENSAKRSNPTNGQGAYQLYSYTAGGTNSNAFLPAGQISDAEFQRQTDIMAELIVNNYGAGLDLSSPSGIKRLFFQYNGAAQRYVNKALSMGFDAVDANNGEGSPYVMNKYDAMRDPSSPNMSPLWPGMYIGDSNWSDTATTSRPGAYTIYVSLGGSDAGSTLQCYIVGAGGGRLIAGGMNLQEAQAFMEAYKNAVRGVSNADLKTLYGMTDNTCSGGIAYNCVSFTRYFINMYTNDYITNHITVGLGNGADIVGSLLGSGYQFTDGGSTPSVYAIFSTSEGSTICNNGRPCGHTGVVLGIDTDNDKIIIGEAACGSGESGIVAREDSLSAFTTSDYRYAYPMKVNGI